MSGAVDKIDGDNLDTAKEVSRLRHRLYDVAAELQPLPTVGELVLRVLQVRGELQRIQEDLQIVLHVAKLEEQNIVGQVEELDRRLADGWVPDSRPVEEIVAELRTEFG